MRSLCTCLCRQAGHHGVCREFAEPGLRLLAPLLTMSSTGEVCRPCYRATASNDMYLCDDRKQPQLSS